MDYKKIQYQSTDIFYTIELSPQEKCGYSIPSDSLNLLWKEQTVIQ